MCIFTQREDIIRMQLTISFRNFLDIGKFIDSAFDLY